MESEAPEELVCGEGHGFEAAAIGVQQGCEAYSVSWRGGGCAGLFDALGISQTVPRTESSPAHANFIVAPPVQSTLPAGVYRTVPYSGIVVVPGPHPDDRCVVRPDGGNVSMPIIKPDLRCIPPTPPRE